MLGSPILQVKCFARLLKWPTSTFRPFLLNIVKLGNSIKWQGSLILGRGANVERVPKMGVKVGG